MKKTSQRDKDLLSLWRERPINKRKEIHIIEFYSDVKEYHPHLFTGINYDPYQYLKGLLRPQIELDELLEK